VTSPLEVRVRCRDSAAELLLSDELGVSTAPLLSTSVPRVVAAGTRLIVNLSAVSRVHRAHPVAVATRW
jgi:hypothetical protein